MKHTKGILPFLNITKGIKKASLPLWIMLFFLSTPNEKGSQSNPKEVAQVKYETLQALQLISLNLQKGIQAMDHLNHYVTTQNKMVKL